MDNLLKKLKKLNKKGDDGGGLSTIKTAILVLVILLVLLFIFKDQISKAVGGFNQVNTDTSICLKTPDDPACKKFLGQDSSSSPIQETKKS